MNNSNLFQILSSKPHNSHYLRRYYRFILGCIDKNKTLPGNVYTENHHICPKSHDSFPEYSDLSKFSWNCAKLTAQQHIIAHIILWKTFGKSQSQALECMLGMFNSSSNKYLSNRKIPTRIIIRYLAKSREDAARCRGINHKEMANYKDECGNRYYLNINDTFIEDNNLVGINSGFKMSAEAKQKMSDAKMIHSKVYLYKETEKIRVKRYSDDYGQRISEGWSEHRTDQHRQHINEIRYKKISDSHSGKTDYMYQDGAYYGKLLKDDPAIEKLGLVFNVTDAKRRVALQNQQLAVAANIGTAWYNDGTVNKKFKEQPGDPWVAGVLYTNKEQTQHNRAEGIREVRSGRICYNDGVSNFYFKETDAVPAHLNKGMAPQKKRNSAAYSGVILYNDGVKTYRIKSGDTVPAGLVKGMAPQKPRKRKQ